MPRDQLPVVEMTQIEHTQKLAQNHSLSCKNKSRVKLQSNGGVETRITKDNAEVILEQNAIKPFSLYI